MILQRRVAVSLILILLGGCAFVPRRGGFDQVQQAIADRTGHQVQWRQDSADDRAVAAVVGQMLDHELTVDQVVQIALLNNRRLQATFEDLGIAQADLVQAGLLRNPSFSFLRRFPGLGAEFDVGQDFMSILLLPLRKKVAEAEFEAARQRVADAVLSLAAQTKAAYYQLQAAEQTLEMRQAVAQATAASAGIARKLHEAGNITNLDQANQEALADQAKLDLAAAEAELPAARERLNVLMGLWGRQTQWTIPKRLPELPAAEVAAEGLEALAISHRLDLAAARQEIVALSRGLGLTKATGVAPEVVIGNHYEREPDGLITDGPSIQTQLPIFDQGQAAVARAQAVLRRSQQRYAALAVEIRSEVRATFIRLLAGRDRAAYYQRVVLPRRRRVTEDTQLQYNAMQVGVFQLLQAKQAEIDAGRDYIEALRSYWVARAELEKAVGGSLQGLESRNPPVTRPTTAPAESGPSSPMQHH